jgi:sugar/nucleoside kinase (ribokinase family)
MDPEFMRAYGTLCGWTLARAHARTGDRIAIAAYLGDDDAFDQVMVEFSERYADRNERDFELVGEAARTGRISVRSGI